MSRKVLMLSGETRGCSRREEERERERQAMVRQCQVKAESCRCTKGSEAVAIEE